MKASGTSFALEMKRDGPVGRLSVGALFLVLMDEYYLMARWFMNRRSFKMTQERMDNFGPFPSWFTDLYLRKFTSSDGAYILVDNEYYVLVDQWVFEPLPIEIIADADLKESDEI